MAERSERTTIYEVARAGVSPAKISRALREDSRFSEATKQTVRLAASELDYLPRAAASTWHSAAGPTQSDSCSRTSTAPTTPTSSSASEETEEHICDQIPCAGTVGE